jgi:outer membrane protein OmpA-like peptidoglycan-associated protein
MISDDATIVLDDIYFNQASATLTQKSKKVLDKFLQTFIPFLRQHKDEIATLEVNGHTSSEWKGVDFTKNYLNNTKLSMQRAFSVVNYMMQQSDKQTQELLASVIRSGGFSFSKRSLSHGVEDKEKSRRVSFKIILKEAPERVYH